jgi:Tol biopolymer transport system component/imidazolonepropionase-like amidohydrolase
MQRQVATIVILLLVAAAGLTSSLAQKSGSVKVKLTEGTNIALALSPDGKTIVFDLQGTLWAMPAGGGKARAITDELGDARQPAFSSDGKRIAFQSYRDGNWHIWTVAPDGSRLAQLTSGSFDDREPHFSPDGGSIAFASDRGGNYDIWKIDLATQRLEQLTRDPANDFNPAYSPDGRRLAFVSERGDARGIRVINNLDDADKRSEVVLIKSNAVVAAPAWSPRASPGASSFAASSPGSSPDGAWVSYQTFTREKGSTELWVKAPGSEQAARLASVANEDVFPFRAAWATNAELFYTADGLIKKLNLTSGERKTIAFEATVELNRPAYARRKRDFDSTASRPARGIVAPAVSPDGKRVAFTALGDLWIQEPGRRAERITDNVFVEAHPRWSPDGKQLAYLCDKQGSMDLWTRDLATGEERMLVKLSAGGSFPTFSPDGKQIAYFTAEGGSPLNMRLQVIDLQTAKSRTVFERGIPPTQISWSPQGDALSVTLLAPNSTRFREGAFEALIIPLDGSKPHRIVPVPHRTLAYAAWSPDGRQMAFVEDGRLSVVAMSEQAELAGTPRRLSDELADAPSWTGDSRSIVYLSIDRLKKINVESGRIEEIPLQLDWQPDKPSGRLIVHAGRLFDGRSSDYQLNVDIVIESNRISEIRPHDASLHQGNVIDASDKTVIPGLIEMHTHQSLMLGEKQGRTWLAFGVTSVREPGTDPYDALERKEAWASGRRAGPREFFTGRLLDGNRVFYGVAEGTANEAHVDLALERARRLEYDLLKAYVRLADPMQKKVAAAAHRMGIPTSSHEIYPAAAYGMDAVEHVSATSRRGYSPKASLLSRSYGDVVQLLAASRMNYTPTLILPGLTQTIGDQPSLVANKQFLVFHGEAMAQSLLARAQAARLQTLRESLAAQGRTVLAVLRAGGRVTAGTDSPLVPFAFTTQLEIQSLVRAGFTPFEALRSATIWSAEAIGVSDDLGSIERGKLADLVIVEGDPLKRIEDTLNVVVTIKNGRPYSIGKLMTAPK